MQQSCWDMVVIGGGPAGSVCATLLARNGWRVLLAESGTYYRPRLADTLCPTTVRQVRLLTGCDVTGGETSVSCRGIIAKWGTRERSITDYELKMGSSGWTVARPETDRLLFKQAGKAGACTREGWRRIKCRSNPAGELHEVTFATQSGCHTERARMVVDATGRSAPPRNGHHLFLDRQLAFATSWRSSAEELKGFLWMESTATGWWYVNATPRGQLQLVFLTDGSRCRRESGGRIKFFHEEFERCVMLKELIGQRPGLSKISVYDARLSVTIGTDDARLFHAGEAAATTDPLSGRGWLRALDSGQAAAAAASQALATRNNEPIALFRRSNMNAFTQHMRVRTELNAQLETDNTFVRGT